LPRQAWETGQSCVPRSHRCEKSRNSPPAQNATLF
jgi:hypothetical protein